MAFIKVAKSGTLSLNEEMGRLQRAGERVYRFGFGESPFSPPLRVQRALKAAALRTDYTPVAGLPQLRQKIADFHQEVDGRPVAMEQVLVAPGSKPLLANIMRAFQAAEVYLPAPSWVSYQPQASLAQHRVLRIPTAYETRWRVLPDALDKLITRQGRRDLSKLLVLNYPGNPDGLSYTRQELEALLPVLRKHGVWVISDEIYGLLHHRGRHLSLASVYPERAIVTTGLSKWCGAGGWRLGALILPQTDAADLRSALIGLGSELYSCAPAPIQAAALAAYELDGALHSYLAGQRRALARIGAAVHGELKRCGLRVHAPEGGFYLLLDFRPFAGGLAAQGIATDDDLCRRLLRDTGVALLPGRAFGMPESDLTARLAYVDFDGDAALAAASAGRDPLPYAGKMLEGIRRMRAWLP